MTIGLRMTMPPRPDVAASYAVPVRRAGTLPTASFRFRVAPDTLAVQLTVPVIRVRRGLPPPSLPSGHHSPMDGACTPCAMPGTHGSRTFSIENSGTTINGVIGHGAFDTGTLSRLAAVASQELGNVAVAMAPGVVEGREALIASGGGRNRGVAEQGVDRFGVVGAADLAAGRLVA